MADNVPVKAKHEYVCERCGHDTSTKSNLLQHLRKQKPCQALNSSKLRTDIIGELLAPPSVLDKREKNYKCEHCQQSFISPQGKCRHKKTCSKKVDASMEGVIKILQNEILKNHNDIKDLQLRIEKQSTTPSGTVQNINTNTNNIQNQQNTNINIIVKSFGEENMSHITHEFLNTCILNPTKGLTNLIEKVHYNADVKENHNLRFKCSKGSLFEKYVSQNWHECDASNTLDELIRKGYRVLNAYHSDYILNNPDIYEDENKFRMYEKFRFLGDKKSVEYSAVKRDLRVLVKDRTTFVLASPDTIIDQDEIARLDSELDAELDDIDGIDVIDDAQLNAELGSTLVKEGVENVAI